MWKNVKNLFNLYARVQHVDPGVQTKIIKDLIKLERTVFAFMKILLFCLETIAL